MLVGGDVVVTCLKLSLFGCFGGKLDLNMSNLDLLDLFGSQMVLC